jgi:hypothetical protein
MDDNVTTVLGQSDIDFGPFAKVLNAHFDRRCRVFRSSDSHSAMNHDLDIARWGDWLIEVKTWLRERVLGGDKNQTDRKKASPFRQAFILNI